MDLLFTKDSARNTTLSLPSGQAVYDYSTPSRGFHHEQTTIRKFRPDGGPPDDIGFIEFHSFHKDICQVRGKDFRPQSSSMWKSGLTFQSSNGQEYTWKRKLSTAELTDKFNNVVAIYEVMHTGILSGNPRPAKLSITVEGMQFLDEIVCTFSYIEQREQKQRQAANSAAASSASSSAAAAAAC
ncbi:hypothetical protein V5O48_011634 [Marasmius crinis-equi]|uniref:DUF6593 domain-containing protein n=1 Tax=Marasmius crinis-equi TaxID=585013 RepID=A0ABR3F582_9AGAR